MFISYVAMKNAMNAALEVRSGQPPCGSGTTCGSGSGSKWWELMVDDFSFMVGFTLW